MHVSREYKGCYWRVIHNYVVRPYGSSNFFWLLDGVNSNGSNDFEVLTSCWGFLFSFLYFWSAGVDSFSSNPMGFYGLLFSLEPGRCGRKIHDLQVMTNLFQHVLHEEKGFNRSLAKEGANQSSLFSSLIELSYHIKKKN